MRLTIHRGTCAKPSAHASTPMLTEMVARKTFDVMVFLVKLKKSFSLEIVLMSQARGFFLASVMQGSCSRTSAVA